MIERTLSEARMGESRRVGIIGIGFGAQVYAPALASEGFEVVAFCSRHAENARKAADAAGVRDIHTDH